MKKNIYEIEKAFWWNRIDAAKEEFETVFKPHDAGCGIIQPNFLIWHWDFGRDFAAYAYELARRADRKLKLRPYPELNGDESQFLFRTFGENKARKEYEIMFRRLNPDEPLRGKKGYSQPAAWKLDAPKNSLLKSFWNFIRQEQEQAGIKPKKKPGQTSKSPPWAYIEIVDKADLLRDVPDHGSDPERTLRTARAHAREYLSILKKELNEAVLKNSNLKSCLWPELERLLSK